MRQLVVLVGVPGSGKTALHQKKPDWVVVSKDVIRQSIFGHSYEPEFESAVDRIFTSALIETAESSASVVCIDDLNLLRRERQSYVELGQMTNRETIAIVMPYEPVDEIYRLVQLQLSELEKRSPRLKVVSLSRDRFDAMLRCYEAVQPEEGFSRILREDRLPLVGGITNPETITRREARRSDARKNPIPLFAA
jgi:predicted kinase